MQVALRERYRDAVFGQLGFERPEIRRARSCRSPRALSINPHQQQEIEAVVTELGQPNIGFAAGTGIEDHARDETVLEIWG